MLVVYAKKSRHWDVLYIGVSSTFPFSYAALNLFGRVVRPVGLPPEKGKSVGMGILYSFITFTSGRKPTLSFTVNYTSFKPGSK